MDSQLPFLGRIEPQMECQTLIGSPRSFTLACQKPEPATSLAQTCSATDLQAVLQISEEEYKRLWNQEVQSEFPAGQAPDIDKVQPAPMWPQEIQSQYDRFQWIFYLLRKAYMQPSPDSAARHLIDAGVFFPQFLPICPQLLDFATTCCFATCCRSSSQAAEDAGMFLAGINLAA